MAPHSQQKFLRSALLIYLWVTSLLVTIAATATPLISEFMADNRSILSDEDGEFSDWIEIHNTGGGAVNLGGWFLTDKATSLDLWQFPSTNLPAGSRLVVFASAKNRTRPGAPLHTGFQLNSEGEYLALVMPDRKTVVSQFHPRFPRQVPDASYGAAGNAIPVPLFSENAPLQFKVPTDAESGTRWTGSNEPFPQMGWVYGTARIGFQTPAGSLSNSSLQAYWEFESTAVDSISRRSPALLRGPVYTNVAPPAFPESRSLYLDGINDTVDLGDLALSRGTLSLWINPRDVGAGSGDRRLLSHVAGATSQAGSLGIDPNGDLGNGSLWIWSGSQWLRLCGDNTLTVNQWQHLALVAEGSHVTFYHNGIRKNQVASRFEFSGTPAVIGAPFLTRFGRYFSGHIDNVNVWGTDLDASQIMQLAAGVSPTSMGGYLPFIQTDVVSRMHTLNSSLYLRIPFELDASLRPSVLEFRARYDDGFVAWLNGQEIARRHAPNTILWNSEATLGRTVNAALHPESILIDTPLSLLKAGTNILAIQALNQDKSDPDLLMAPELLAYPPDQEVASSRYFGTPTPGRPNGAVSSDLGPAVSEVTSATLLQPRAPLIVTARVAATLGPIFKVTLHYRVMFEEDQLLEMKDDGQTSDGAAGDMVFGGLIPPATAKPDQMIRYAVVATDTKGRASRWPLFHLPKASPEYLGARVHNPATTSSIPILHWFVRDTAAATTSGGTRASLFFLDEFYDNVFVRSRGVASASYPKPSQKFDFNPGYHFRYSPEVPRIEEFNLITTYADNSYLREMLAYEAYQFAGAVASDAFMLRIHRNGTFYSLDTFVEQPDEDYLAHHGLDPRGALYKNYNSLENPVAKSYSFYENDTEKRTREWEDFSDLTNLVAGVSPALPSMSRAQYLFDHVDLPAMMNYLAASVMIQDLDHETHNYYAYRDTEGNGEWRLLPWDRNFSFGIGNPANQDPGSHPLLGSSEFVYPPWQFLEGKDVQWNRLTDSIYDTPGTREMFLRRLRTLMDAWLQPPGIPDSQLKLSQRLAQLRAEIEPDAKLDAAKWGHAPLVSGISELKSFLALRRTHLYVTHNITNRARYPRAAGIPAAQMTPRTIQFGEIDANPISGDQDEEFIQLVNTNSTSVDLSGWRLAGGVRYTLKPGVVIPSGGALYLSPNVTSFRARQTGPSGMQALFVQGNYERRLSDLGDQLELLSSDGTRIAAVASPRGPSLVQQFLRITEVMYHPAEPPPGTPYRGADFEFVELKNIGPNPLELAGVRFTTGIQFQFSKFALPLKSADHLLLVRNLAAFRTRYPSPCARIEGDYSGSLENAGEAIRLEDAEGGTILHFTYSDSWYALTDGGGSSLRSANPGQPQALWNEQAGWRPSGMSGGSPGQDEQLPPALDGDFDNLPDDWEQARLGGLDESGTDDSDGDGATHLEEFVAGSDPMDREDRLQTLAQPLDGGLMLSFQTRAVMEPGYAGWKRYYALEGTPDLARATWSSVEGATQIPGNGEAHQNRLFGPDASPRFFRVRVWLECE